MAQLCVPTQVPTNAWGETVATGRAACSAEKRSSPHRTAFAMKNLSVRMRIHPKLEGLKRVRRATRPRRDTIWSSMRQRLAFLVLLFAVARWRPQPRAAPQRGGKPAPDVPPVSMTCPMHPDVVDSTPGNCPICKMSLVPVRLESVWTCPVHAVVAEEHAGVCPIDRRDLIQVTMAVTFTCAGHPEINQIEPGSCPDGKAMIKTRTLRPHGNHNPQYGGQFFMAPDNTHHLEGAFPRARLFRLYLYDDYARPLPADRMKAVKARVVTNETFDAATRTTREIAAFPLVRAGRGYLEARVDTARLPAQLTAKVKFKSDAPEYRFDFTFTELSKKPAPPPSAAARPRVEAPRRPARALLPGRPARRSHRVGRCRPAPAASPTPHVRARCAARRRSRRRAGTDSRLRAGNPRAVEDAPSGDRRAGPTRRVWRGVGAGVSGTRFVDRPRGTSGRAARGGTRGGRTGHQTAGANGMAAGRVR